MTLESIVQLLKPKPLKLSNLLSIGAISLMGCSGSVVVYSQTENQGGSAGDDQGGAAGFGEFGGFGGSGGSEEECTLKVGTLCKEGDVYWVDSCSNIGDLYQLCSETQTCQEGQCVEKEQDCMPITPATGCQELSCVFYDSFENQLCKWDTISGAGKVENQTLFVTDKTLLDTKEMISLYGECNGNFTAQYKLQLLDGMSGSFYFSHQNEKMTAGAMMNIIQTPEYENKVFLRCNDNEKVIEGFNLHNGNPFTMKRAENELSLYVNNTLAGSVDCTNMYAPITKMHFYLGSANTPQGFKIDDISINCP